MSVRSAAAEAGNHPVVEKGARLGYAATGVLHLLVGWLALRLAWSDSATSADQTGALRSLAGSTGGSVVLWGLVVGFGILALWLLTEAAVVRDTGDRLKSLGKGVTYLVLTGLTVGVLRGSGGGGGGEPSSLTAQVLQLPLGRVLVGAAGLGIVAAGVYHVVKGWRATFLEDLQGHPGRWAERAGRLGYVAKGVALGLVGAFVVVAAATSDPERAKGLDAALRSLLELPFGAVLLTLVALGFVAYGLYSFVRARYARV